MELIKIKAHSKPVTQIKYNKEGTLLFASSKDKTCSSWNTKTGKISNRYYHDSSVTCFDVNEASNRLITGDSSGIMRLFDVKSGLEITGNFKTDNNPIRSIQFSSSGKQFIVGFDRLFDNVSKVCLFSLPAECINTASYNKKDIIKEDLCIKFSEKEKITTCVFGIKDDHIICGFESGKISIYSIKNGTCKKTLNDHEGPIKDIQLSKDKLLIITASADKTSRLYDCNFEATRSIYISSNPVNSAAISPLKKHICLGGGTEAIHVTTTSDKSQLFNSDFYHLVFEDMFGTVVGHFGPIHSLDFSPDGTGFSSGGEDGMIHIHWFDKKYLELSDGIE